MTEVKHLSRVEDTYIRRGVIEFLERQQRVTIFLEFTRNEKALVCKITTKA